jgi:hypothetical protein
MSTVANEESEVLNVSLSLTSCPSSQRISIELKSNIGASELYDLVSHATKIPRSSLKLIFRGKLIPFKENEADVVQKFLIEDGCVIHCMGKPVSAGEGTTEAAAASSSTPAVAAATTTPARNLAAAMNSFQVKCTSETYSTALKTLSKILENIIGNPNEEKYRKLKCSNATFMKRLGSLDGAKDILVLCGFDFDQQEYVIIPTADKWEILTQAKVIVDQRIMSSASNVSAPFTSSAPSSAQNTMSSQSQAFQPMQQNPGVMEEMARLMSNSEMMDQMRAQIMNNPVMMEEMARLMSNPARMEEMRRMMSNPAMMDQMRTQMMHNPAMMESMSRLVSNPVMMEEMTRLMRNPAMMDQIRTQMMSNPSMMEQMAMGNPQMYRQAPSSLNMQQQPQQLDLNAMRQALSAVSQLQGAANSTTSGPTSADQEMTEEEMIQEAIRRSLQD